MDLDATQILTAASRGDAEAAARLWPLVYDELREVSAAFLRREPPDLTLQATALVHEAFLRLVDQTRVEWRDRTHFCAVAAQAMRRILIDHARARNARKRGSAWERVLLDEAVQVFSERSVDLLALDEVLSRLAGLDPREARVVELRFFGGLSNPEVADLLGVSLRTVEDDWRAARAWLR